MKSLAINLPCIEKRGKNPRTRLRGISPASRRLAGDFQAKKPDKIPSNPVKPHQNEPRTIIEAEHLSKIGLSTNKKREYSYIVRWGCNWTEKRYDKS